MRRCGPSGRAARSAQEDPDQQGPHRAAEGRGPAQAERQGDYGKVAEIRYGKIQEAEKQIAAFQEEYKLVAANGSMIKEEVDAQDVAEVVSRWTGR